MRCVKCAKMGVLLMCHESNKQFTHFGIWVLAIQRLFGFVQMVAGQYRVIDYLEDNRKAIDFYVRQIQSRPYVYERHFCHMTVIMPTSLQGRLCAKLSRVTVLKVEITPQIGIDNGINATRMAMPNVWMNEISVKRHKSIRVLSL